MKAHLFDRYGLLIHALEVDRPPPKEIRWADEEAFKEKLYARVTLSGPHDVRDLPKMPIRRFFLEGIEVDRQGTWARYGEERWG